MADDTQQLGKYRILEELGRGGFATVYRALDTTLEREVALKLLDPLLMRDENWVARFHREAKAVARLKHPHIVTVYEIGEVKDRIYIAMELVAGGSLKERVADQGPFSWEAALPLAAQVAAALDEAHGQGILHRDLKPGNVLLDPKAGAVLTDFGFARIVGESSMSVSLSGGVVGTPAYIAPEVWDGKETTVQTDLYALACVVYEMVTGEVLFGGETPSVVMRKHLIDGPRFPAQWPAGVPGGVEDVLRQALAREPGQRHGSAGQMMAALQALTPPPAPSAAPRAGERVQEEARPERPLTSPPGPSPSPRERGEPPLRGEGE
ncbi:MAG: serine/threonine protein kinase, partial [Anaerolineae bacterium]|nr:serine/threonine protein kinase [Anaerolineae bacterium]